MPFKTSGQVQFQEGGPDDGGGQLTLTGQFVNGDRCGTQERGHGIQGVARNRFYINFSGLMFRFES